MLIVESASPDREKRLQRWGTDAVCFAALAASGLLAWSLSAFARLFDNLGVSPQDLTLPLAGTIIFLPPAGWAAAAGAFVILCVAKDLFVKPAVGIALNALLFVALLGWMAYASAAVFFELQRVVGD
jgi:uncharacterized membrane protein YczE